MPSGGFAGVNSGTITLCYYDEETSGQSDIGKGEPRSTEDMTDPHDFLTTFIDWDFINVWQIHYSINDGYPTFFEGTPTFQLGSCVPISIDPPSFPSITEVFNVGIYLCKPNKTIVAKLSDAYDVQFSAKALQLNELRFKLPFQLDQYNQLIENLNAKTAIYRYFVKIVINDYIEYFYISQPIKESMEEYEYKEFICYSLANELRHRDVSYYNVEHFTLKDVFEGKSYCDKNDLYLMRGILYHTNWTVRGDFCSFYDTKERDLHIGGSGNILDLILNMIVPVYNVIPIFDTVHRCVWLYDEDSIGKTTDEDILRLSYRKYLKSMDLREEGSDFITRLHMQGKDNTTIHEIVPTGQSYIEDFSYFLDNYLSDGFSHYWSNALCAAQLAYESKITSYQSAYDDLISQRKALLMQRLELEVEAYDLGNILLHSYDRIMVLQNITGGYYGTLEAYAGEGITLTAENLNPHPSVYHFFMGYIEDTTNFSMRINGEPKYLSPGVWMDLGRYTELEEITISLSGTGETDVYLIMCRIPWEQHEDNGTPEIQSIYLGNPTEGAWRLGRGDDVWTQLIPHDASGKVVEGHLRSLYYNNYPQVEKDGNVLSSDIHYIVTFPVNYAGGDSNLEGDFTHLVTRDAFINKEQSRLTLLQMYNPLMNEAIYEAKIAEIEAVQLQIDGVDASLQAIWNDLAIANNFSSALITERNNFIIERTYNNGGIDEPEELFIAGAEYFQNVNEPKLFLHFDSINFIDSVETSADHDKLFYELFNAGLYDTVVVKYEPYNLSLTCKISEIHYNYEDEHISFVVSNVNEVLTLEKQFIADLNYAKGIADIIHYEKPWEQDLARIDDLGRMSRYNTTDIGKVGNSLLRVGCFRPGFIDAGRIDTGKLNPDVFAHGAISTRNLRTNSIDAEALDFMDRESTGKVDTDGTTVTWISGNPFDITWETETEITINESVYEIISVESEESLTINVSAGTQENADYLVTVSLPLNAITSNFTNLQMGEYGNCVRMTDIPSLDVFHNTYRTISISTTPSAVYNPFPDESPFSWGAISTYYNNYIYGHNNVSEKDIGPGIAVYRYSPFGLYGEQYTIAGRLNCFTDIAPQKLRGWSI